MGQKQAVKFKIIFSIRLAGDAWQAAGTRGEMEGPEDDGLHREGRRSKRWGWGVLEVEVGEESSKKQARCCC